MKIRYFIYLAVIIFASCSDQGKRSSNPYQAGIQLYWYNMQADSCDFVHSGWTFSSNGAQPTAVGLKGALYVNKQINIETKIQRARLVFGSDTNIALYTPAKEGNEYQTIVSVNATNNSINIYNRFAGTTIPEIRKSKIIGFPLIAGREYIVEMYRLPRGNGIRIIDTLTGDSDRLEDFSNQSIIGNDDEVYAGGNQYDMFGIMLLGGTASSVYIREMSCGYFGVKNPLLYIIGDSITYGYGTNTVEDTYAHHIGKLTNGDYVISARGGGKINGVLERLQTECAIIKPMYVMITIGTNEPPTVEQLQQIATEIRSIGSIPIINCIPCRAKGEQEATNRMILALGEYSCRFDIATAVDPTAETLTADPSLFIDRGVHPNIRGFKRMSERIRIDLPFLF